jgi:hypothetical protein
MNNELLRIEVPMYLRRVLMSKNRMKKYYIKSNYIADKTKKSKKKLKELPKKYSDSNIFIWKKKGINECLFNVTTEEFVIANPRVHGTERWNVINGQDIYNGNVQKWTRNKIIPLTQFPINIFVEIHDLVYDPLLGNQLWDVDNRAYPYTKAFQDALKKNKIIPDDNILYITQAPAPKFIPVDDEKDRKLVFIFVKETDKRILDNKIYKNESLLGK